MLLSLFLLPVSVLSQQIANPYRLSAESHLAQRFHHSIIDEWQQQTEQLCFKGVGKLNIHYSLTRAKTPNHRLIVISPGRTEGYLKYQELVLDLSAQGYDVAVIDHRGQGFSDRTTEDSQLGDVESYTHYVADLKTLYRELKKRSDAQDYYLLAHSMGSAIGALYLQKYPKDFKAAVFSSPMFGINFGVPTTMVAPLAKLMHQVDLARHNTPQFSLSQGPYDDREFDDNRLSHSRVRYEIFRALYKDYPQMQIGGPSHNWLVQSFIAMDQVLTGAKDMTTPTLVLQAGDDKVVDNDQQLAFCEARTKVACETGSVVVFPEAAHEIFIERDEIRTKAITRILDFYADQSL